MPKSHVLAHFTGNVLALSNARWGKLQEKTNTKNTYQIKESAACYSDEKVLLTECHIDLRPKN